MVTTRQEHFFGKKIVQNNAKDFLKRERFEVLIE